MPMFNVRPPSRLLAVSGAGGLLGALLVGGPLGIVGGLALGWIAEETYARFCAIRPASAMGCEPRQLPPGADDPLTHVAAAELGFIAGTVLEDATSAPAQTDAAPARQGREAVAHHKDVAYTYDTYAQNPAPSPPQQPQASGGGAFGVDATGLKVGQQLLPGQKIPSPNGAYFLTLETDGNLVLYTSGYQPVWSSGTSDSGATRAVMEKDGTLALQGPGNAVVWQGATGGPGGRLTIHDDGNLVVYSSMGIPAWSSNTAQS
jgi:hypothetical protein